MRWRTRYRFLYQADGRYYWESTLPLSPGESRHESVSCDAGWFWGERGTGAVPYRKVRAA